MLGCKSFIWMGNSSTQLESINKKNWKKGHKDCELYQVLIFFVKMLWYLHYILFTKKIEAFVVFAVYGILGHFELKQVFIYNFCVEWF